MALTAEDNAVEQYNEAEACLRQWVNFSEHILKEFGQVFAENEELRRENEILRRRMQALVMAVETHG